MSNAGDHRTRDENVQRLFRCDWPNGDVSFVLAEDEEDAIFKLDEVAAAESSMLVEVDTFQIHLALTRSATDSAPPSDDTASAPPSDDEEEWEFVLEGFGGDTAEIMDLEAAVARKRDMDSGETPSDSAMQAPHEEKAARRQRPLVQMSDIELRRAFDEIERGPGSLLGPMLDDVRAGRSGDVLRTSAVVLVLPDQEERPVAAFAEHGDGEGRESAACCLRFCAHLGVLRRGERLERVLLETRLLDLTSTRSEDPVAADSGSGWLELHRMDVGPGLRSQLDSQEEAWREQVAEARKEAKALLVSVGLLTFPDGTTRSFCESGELGDNGGRMLVADNIRTCRRVGLLQEGESLARHMLEIRLQPLRAELKPDALREARTGGRSPASPGKHD